MLLSCSPERNYIYLTNGIFVFFKCVFLLILSSCNKIKLIHMILICRRNFVVISYVYVYSILQKRFLLIIY